MSAGTNRSIPTPVSVPNGGTGLTAGTSGGIPAYTGATTIASSGVLAASALVIGGGAGVAPSTTTTGAGVLVGTIARPILTRTSVPGTTTLTVTSAATQTIAGTDTHTFEMPVVTTLVAGWATLFVNKSTLSVTLNSSGGNEIVVLASGQSVTLSCPSIYGDTTAAAWDVVGLSPVLEFTATLASDQSFAFNVEETVIFQGAVGSLASALNGATGVFTAPKAGTVILSGVINFTVSGSSEYDYGAFISYVKNGGSSQAISAASFSANSGYAEMGVPFNFPLAVAAGDTVEISANLQDNSGGGTLLVKSYSGWTVKYA